MKKKALSRFSTVTVLIKIQNPFPFTDDEDDDDDDPIWIFPSVFALPVRELFYFILFFDKLPPRAFNLSIVRKKKKVKPPVPILYLPI